MSDPVRDALKLRLDQIYATRVYTDDGFATYDEAQAFENGQKRGASEMLAVYDEAKLAHGDTTLDTTKRVRRPGKKK